MNNKEYITKDLGEVAALLTHGCDLRGDIQWKDNTAYFVFKDSEQCKDPSSAYFFGTLLINARLYYENLRMIKRKLYTEQNKGGVKYVPNSRLNTR